jgi:hypothetical protein
MIAQWINRIDSVIRTAPATGKVGTQTLALPSALEVCYGYKRQQAAR